MSKEAIRDITTQHIIGYMEDKGDRIVATDFYGRILGHYDVARDLTFDFYGRIICNGNGLSGLIMNAER